MHKVINVNTNSYSFAVVFVVVKYLISIAVIEGLLVLLNKVLRARNNQERFAQRGTRPFTSYDEAREILLA